VRLDPIEREQPEALGNRAPLALIANEVEPFTLANLVEPEVMSEAVVHSELPIANIG
jgi:hypothetical protein